MATFGKATKGGTEQASGSSYAVANGPFSPASDGTLTALSLWTKEASGAVQLAIFNDNGGAPGTMLAITGGGTSVANDFVTIATTTTPTVYAANSYWLAWNADFGGNYTIAVDTVSGKTHHYDPVVYPGFVDPYDPAGNVADQEDSIYATYTPSGGGPSIPILSNHYKQQQ